MDNEYYDLTQTSSQNEDCREYVLSLSTFSSLNRFPKSLFLILNMNNIYEIKFYYDIRCSSVNKRSIRFSLYDFF